jgi:hypothetical protein
MPALLITRLRMAWTVKGAAGEGGFGALGLIGGGDSAIRRRMYIMSAWRREQRERKRQGQNGQGDKRSGREQSDS